MARDRLDIIYEDKEIVVVNKPAHLLCIATEDEKINTLYHKVLEFERKKNKNNKIFIVHRLDKETSGVVVFAKNQKLKEAFQKDWNNLAIRREYLAIVEGKVQKSKDHIVDYLTESKTLQTYKTSEKNGKKAITNYEVISSDNQYTKLCVWIETGRKNQIRVAMQGINHPIVGDKKYGAKKNPIRRMCLHANKLVLKNPLNGEIYEFIAKTPKEFSIFK